MYSIATYRTSTDSKAEALRSEDFFTKNREDYIWGWRHAIQRDERRLYCGFCGQLLKISGGGESKQRVHFRHKFKHAAENCIFQDDESLSKQVIEWQKYANEEESVLHKQSKLLIADTLEKYGADTRIEQYIKDEQNHGHYRRPDVHAIFPDKDVVVEVQLTSTFLDVILDRRDFYQSHKMFLMWVVNEFRPDLFPQKDIFYSSRENIFVFDAEARMCTAKEGKLYLKCYHRSYYCDESGEIRELDFQCDWITFEDLTFDTNDYTVYYFDESVNKEQCKAERARILKERDEKEELERKRLDAIRIQREIEEQKRNRLLQIQKELAQKEEEKRKRKQEAEQKEQARQRELKRELRTKLDNYVYCSSISLTDYWQYYQHLNKEERFYTDDYIHEIIINHVFHQNSGLPSIYYGSQHYNDENVNQLYVFLRRNNYAFDWHRLESITERYFGRYNYKNKILYQYITFDLYANCNYHMPHWDVYFDNIQQNNNNIIQAAQDNERQYYASCFDDNIMLILCYEKLHKSPLAHDKEAYKLVYKNREVIRRLYAIYLGELLGQDYSENRYYDSVSLSNKFASPYLDLYKNMAKNRKGYFHEGLVPNFLIHLKDIEKTTTNLGIEPKHDLDTIMPTLFPIQWALQQTLF